MARVLVGFAVAVVCTPAGVSGAFLLLPVQTQVFHVPSPAVSATNLVHNLQTFALASAAGIGRAAAPIWADGVALGLGGLVGAVVGARLQPRLPLGWLRGVIAVAAVAAGRRTLA